MRVPVDQEIKKIKKRMKVGKIQNIKISNCWKFLKQNIKIRRIKILGTVPEIWYCWKFTNRTVLSENAIEFGKLNCKIIHCNKKTKIKWKKKIQS